MKHGKTRLSLITALAVIMAFAMLLSSCAKDDVTTAPSGDATTAPKGDVTTDAPTNGGNLVDPTEPNNTEPDGESDISLAFGDDMTATAEVTESRKITVYTKSDYLQIKGNGKFTVSVDGGKAQTSDDNNELKIENTADAGEYKSMVLEFTVNQKTTLTFTLLFNPGSDGNPYVISETEPTTLTYVESVHFSVAGGWYQLTGTGDFELTNYDLSEDGLVYLKEGTYGVSVEDKEKENTVTITPAAAPMGYDPENPMVVNSLGNVSMKIYSGTKLYFRFEAPEQDLYAIGLGEGGKSGNCRFAVSTEDYAVYYGREYQDGDWLTCEGGLNYGVIMNQDATITIALEYMDEGMIGDDTAAISITAAKKITELNGMDTATLGKGKAFFSYTATEKAVYTVSAVNSTAQLWVLGDAESENKENTKIWTAIEGTTVRLGEGETVYIALSGTANSGAVSVAKAVEEDLPTTWKSATYRSADKKYEMVLNCESKTVELTISSIKMDAARFYYLDGKATFTANSTEYTLVQKEDGSFELTYVSNASSKDVTATLIEKEEIVAVDISKWSGVYKSKDGASLTIDTDGSGVTDRERYDAGSNDWGYEENVLTWGQMTIEIAEQDANGNIKKLKVTVHGSTESVIYSITDEKVVMPPRKIAELKDGEKYEGDGFTMTTIGSNRFNSVSYTVIGNPAAKTYVIAGYDPEMDAAVYKLVIAEDEIKVYDMDDQLLATMVKQVFAAGTLGKDSTTVDESGKYDANYYLTVNDTGWYTFSNSAIMMELHTGLKVQADSWFPVEETVNKTAIAGTVAVYLKKGDMVFIYNPEYVSVNVSYSVKAPEGMAENPKDLDDTKNIFDLSALLKGKDVYYVRYVAPSNGTYNIRTNSENIHFVIDGVDYGRELDGWYWVTYDTTCTVTLKAGDEVLIAINRGITTGSNEVLAISTEDVTAMLQNQGYLASPYVFDEDMYGEWKHFSHVDDWWDSYDVGYKLNISASGVTYSEIDYSGAWTEEETIEVLQSGDKIYFKNGGEYLLIIGTDSITLDIYDEQYVLTRGDDDDNGGSDVGGEDLFTEEQKGEYKYDNGNGNWVNLTINADGSISYADYYESSVSNVFPNQDRGAYSFVCDGATMTFSFEDDGSIDFNDGSCNYTLTKQEAEAPAEGSREGTYSGKVTCPVTLPSEINVTLIVSANSVTFKSDVGNNITVAITVQDSGNQITVTSDGDYVTFDFNEDGSISMVYNYWYTDYEGTLTK